MPKTAQTLQTLMQPAEKPAPQLQPSALWYAQQHIPVFPCWPHRKTPATRHGCKDATTNPDQIREWWTQNPNYNIGLAAGHRFDVIDIDGPEGHHQRAHYWCNVEGCESVGAAGEPCGHDPGTFAAIEANTKAKVLTPRPGGMHLYVPATGDGNSASIVPKIDYRGKGGFILAPPSRITETDYAGTYQFLGTPNLTKE